MHRVETSIRALHERVEVLEQLQAAQGPSDEQVERVLRKILAERFGESGSQRFQKPNELKDGDHLARRRHVEFSVPKTISIDAASLLVNPDAVPSKAYGESFQMLEKGLQDFPRVDVAKSVLKDSMQVDQTEVAYKHTQPSAH
jgi:hypothetical protein